MDLTWDSLASDEWYVWILSVELSNTTKHFPVLPGCHQRQIPLSLATTCDMSVQSRLQVLFEATLQDYEKQTDIALAKHPLAEQLQNCDSVDSVTAVLDEQLRAFSEFREGHTIMKPLKHIVSILYKISAFTDLNQVRREALIGCSKSLNLIL